MMILCGWFWLVCAYVKETGDNAILDKMVSYDSKLGSECPLYVHLQRAIQYTLDRLGPHGFALDWPGRLNDCLNRTASLLNPANLSRRHTGKDGKVAESVFIGGMLVLAAHEMVDLAGKIKK